MSQPHDRHSKTDSRRQAPPCNFGGKAMCLSQETTRVYPRSSASQTKSASVFKSKPEIRFGVCPPKPAQATISKIILAKIFGLRYIGVSWPIRFSIPSRLDL